MKRLRMRLPPLFGGGDEKDIDDVQPIGETLMRPANFFDINSARIRTKALFL